MNRVCSCGGCNKDLHEDQVKCRQCVNGRCGGHPLPPISGINDGIKVEAN